MTTEVLDVLPSGAIVIEISMQWVRNHIDSEFVYIKVYTKSLYCLHKHGNVFVMCFGDGYLKCK